MTMLYEIMKLKEILLSLSKGGTNILQEALIVVLLVVIINLVFLLTPFLVTCIVWKKYLSSSQKFDNVKILL